MKHAAAIKSLSVSFPRRVITNAWWESRQGEVLAGLRAHDEKHVWRAREKQPEQAPRALGIFEEEMAPYLRDPFRGAVERRALETGEKAVDVEMDAIRRALAAAGMQASQIDLILVSAMFADNVAPGDAIFLAQKLGTKVPAWNLETACGGTTAALSMACAFVSSGQFRNVLVVTSCTYSRSIPPQDSMAWVSGDGAAAMVVGRCPEGFGFLGNKHINTVETLDAIVCNAENGDDGIQRIMLSARRSAGRVLMETAEPYLRTCVEGALQAAELSLAQIDHFAFASPSAWYVKACCRVLGISPDKAVDCFPRFGNIGPVLMPVNLFYGAQAGKIRHGDRVLLYSVGSSSSAGAVVMRWGDTALGTDGA